MSSSSSEAYHSYKSQPSAVLVTELQMPARCCYPPALYPPCPLVGSILQQSFALGGCSGKYEGPEDVRLAIQQQAADLGADHVDIELKAAQGFFAGK